LNKAKNAPLKGHGNTGFKKVHKDGNPIVNKNKFTPESKKLTGGQPANRFIKSVPNAKNIFNKNSAKKPQQVDSGKKTNDKASI
jgi:hypothetical protein